MKHIVKDISTTSLALFEPKKTHPFITENIEDILIFDIETTGLHHQHCEVILIGYFYVKNGCYYIEQIFAETPNEEKELLEKFKIVSSKFNYLLSYNGNSFDIPFLNSRYQKYHLDYLLDKSLNIDLLRVARLLSKTLKLENYKLKTVEQFLGIYRKDEISGKESVELYNRYIFSPNAHLKEVILLHNFEDILYLAKVADLLYYQKHDDWCNLPILFLYDKRRYYIRDFKISKDFLKLKIFSRDLKQKRIHFSSGQLSLEQSEQLITLKAPVFKITVDDSVLNFIDIDLISEGKINFNSLSYNKKLAYLVSPLSLPTAMKTLFNIIG